MDWWLVLIIFVAGFGLGLGTALFFKKTAKQLANELFQENENLRKENMELVKKDWENSFGKLSYDALSKSNEEFLKLAKENLEKYQEGAKGDLELRQKAIDNLVKPIQDKLSEVDKQNKKMEEVRISAYSGLTEQVKSITEILPNLRDETTKLSMALRDPTVRGQWGEMQLRNVVELAGMLPYCDFIEQVSITTDEGRFQPDMIVRLPGKSIIVVDAKAPLKAYLDACETNDTQKSKELLEEHAKNIRKHMNDLSAKNYWKQFPSAPDFVIMFLPGENFFIAGLEHDKRLIEDSSNNRVIIASPITLIALLRAVAYGWKQEKLSENAMEIQKLGKELYDRVQTMTEHLTDLGKGLKTAIESYNKTIGSFENRVLVTTRKFKELGATSDEKIPGIEPVDASPRQIQDN